MTEPGKTAAEWQSLLDEKFPQGALVTPVLKDGTLSPDVFRIPLLMVAAMRGEWPLIIGIDAAGRDLALHTASWEEIDRDGHFVARTKMAAVKEARPGEFELSSWLSPELAEAFAEVRDGQREWLSQVVESAAPEVALEPGVAPAEADSELAPSAEPTEDMALTLTHI